MLVLVVTSCIDLQHSEASVLMAVFTALSLCGPGLHKQEASV